MLTRGHIRDDMITSWKFAFFFYFLTALENIKIFNAYNILRATRFTVLTPISVFF